MEINRGFVNRLRGYTLAILDSRNSELRTDSQSASLSHAGVTSPMFLLWTTNAKHSRVDCVVRQSMDITSKKEYANGPGAATQRQGTRTHGPASWQDNASLYLAWIRLIYPFGLRQRLALFAAEQPRELAVFLADGGAETADGFHPRIP